MLITFRPQLKRGFIGAAKRRHPQCTTTQIFLAISGLICMTRFLRSMHDYSFILYKCYLYASTTLDCGKYMNANNNYFRHVCPVASEWCRPIIHIIALNTSSLPFHFYRFAYESVRDSCSSVDACVSCNDTSAETTQWRNRSLSLSSF